MKMINRVVYLLYYINMLDWHKFLLFQSYLKSLNGTSYFHQWFHVIYNSIKYNISILEYYQFRFFEKIHDEKLEWAGTGYMYEYQKKMNPIKSREIFSNKKKFNNQFKEFIKHSSVTLEELSRDINSYNSFISKTHDKIVIKSSTGGCGVGIEVFSKANLTYDKLLSKLIETGNDIVEEFVIQHDDLMKLSSSGLNTVRIITQITTEKKVEIIGCRLRISVNSHIDNLAAGNIVASIHKDSGVVNTDAVYSDITKTPVKYHPVTGVKIKGFKLPFWKQTIELIQSAAIKFPDNKSIGWDIAITNFGPELIEGNHDWCKLVWQLPEQKGLKSIIEKYYV